MKIAQQRAGAMIREAKILMTDTEQERIQVADFGLSHLEKERAQILTFVDTDRIGVKVIVLFPLQTLPEHWHPRVENDPGKEETFRVIWGTLYFYHDGLDTLKEGHIPEGKDRYYTARHERVMYPADQIYDSTWMQALASGWKRRMRLI